MTAPTRIGRRWWYAIAALVLVQAFVGNEATPLWDEDEAAYAAFARVMIRTGDWVVPHFLWSTAHRKTPFLFWCIAILFKLFGESNFAVRLPTTLAILAVAGTTAWLGRRIVGRRAAWFAALVLAANVFLPNLGKVAVTDAIVLLCDTLVALALEQLLETAQLRWTALFWAALSVGLLTKGPPTLLLAGGLFLWTLVFDPRRRMLWRLHPWLGAPLALLPITAWIMLAWHHTNGTLIRWMWEWYIARRALGGTVFGQIGPPGYHLALIFLGLLPWTILLPLAIARGRDLWNDPRSRLLVGWLVFGWFVWELLPSKLPAYAIGAWPAVALLLGRELDRLTPEVARSRWVRVGIVLAGIVTLAIAVALPWVAEWKLGRTAGVLGAIALVPWVAGLLLGTRALLRADAERAARAWALGSLGLVILGWTTLVPIVSARRDTGRDLARAADTLDPSRQRPIYFTDNLHRPSLPYELGRDRAVSQLTAAELAQCHPGIYVGWADHAERLPPPDRALIVDGWSPDGDRHFKLAVGLHNCEARP